MIKRILVTQQDDLSHILILVSKEHYHTELANQLGDCISIKVEQDALGIISLWVFPKNGNASFHVNTQQTIKENESLGWLKNEQVKYWTSGRVIDGRTVLDVPIKSIFQSEI